MNKQSHYLIFDVSNMLYRTFHANKKHDVDTASGLAHHTALNTLNKYYKKFQPDKVIMAFDRPNWRKDYTLSEQCVSEKIYKGKRRLNMTPSEKEKFERFLEHISEFEQIMRKHTSVICLSAEKCEADDLIAIFTDVFPDDRSTIISADKDLIQLLRNDNVSLYDPATGKPRTLKEWNGDAELYLFEKYFRGDPSDNIQKAYPGIRKTKILDAYKDEYVKANVMQHIFKIPLGDNKFKEVVTKDVFKENQLLMDLRKQPEEVKRTAVKEILKETKDPGTFSYFHFLQFCGKHELKKISEHIESFSQMLSR